MTVVDPQSFNHPDRKLLGPDQIDDLGLAIISLTKEVSVLADRVRVLEAVLDKKGLDVSTEIERLEPDEDLQKALDEQGRLIAKSVLDALKGNPAGS